MLKKVLLPALGGTILLVAVVYGCRYWNWEEKRTPEELARIALEGETPEARQLAAAELTEYGEEAKSLMREVLSQSDHENVRATMIHGLGRIYDYDSMEIILAGLQDESPIVRGRSAVAARKMIGRSFHYDPSMSKEQRAEVVQAIRKEWENIRDSGLIEHFKERMKRREEQRE